ncbi:hypothetical protein VPH35_033719 [Triticum aestivum]|uniref:Uncharacterized protein n=1 Tax=Aegilops tauschii TaxID=37682 RepID=M8BXX8_AEGTA
MEVAVSAVASELVSRQAQSEQKAVEKLQHLMTRACTFVEEADARYITNSGMMMQLKMLSEAMYRGHSLLDTLRCRALQYGAGFDEVSNSNSSSSSLYLASPLKRSRTTAEEGNKAMGLDSHGALESLEIAITNISEFVVLLAGCERMSRRPYDVYFYTDNFMFSQHAEKQKLLSFLLEDNDPSSDHALAILPLIGGAAVGKKTLVAQLCGDESVRSRFSSILHLNRDKLLGYLTMEGPCDDDWKKIHPFLIRMGRGSKIIIGRLEKQPRCAVLALYIGQGGENAWLRETSPYMGDDYEFSADTAEMRHMNRSCRAGHHTIIRSSFSVVEINIRSSRNLKNAQDGTVFYHKIITHVPTCDSLH